MLVMRRGEIALLLLLLSACHASDKGSLTELLDAAHELRAEGLLDQAAAAYRAAVEKHPDRAEPRFFLGLTARTLDQLDEALDHYHAALSLAPKMAEAHMNVASIYSSTDEQHEQALGHYKTALELREWSPTVRSNAEFNVALALQALGRESEAVGALRRCLTLQPAFEPAVELLNDMLGMDVPVDVHGGGDSSANHNSNGDRDQLLNVVASRDGGVATTALESASEAQYPDSSAAAEGSAAHGRSRCAWETELHPAEHRGTSNLDRLRASALDLERAVQQARLELSQTYPGTRSDASEAAIGLPRDDAIMLAELVSSLGALLAQSYQRR
mmetsp:Transcript_39917/g.105463  ORF Transcript_39917/g.105463 Transcript_39917/m.105463 type:complete len:330 (-) Transcript_39917:343-1332(-)